MHYCVPSDYQVKGKPQRLLEHKVWIVSTISILNASCL